MREFQIKENDANQRVDKFLMKLLPTLPKSLMYKAIRNKKIKVNRKRCEISQRLMIGDIVQCFLAEEFFEQSIQEYAFLKVPKQLEILYEDEWILAAYKPVGILSQKDQQGIQDNMNDRLLHYLYDTKQYDPQEDQSFTPAFVHRLDRNTEGILLAGKTAASLRMLNEKIKTHEIKKYYLALVEGCPTPNSGELKLYYRKQHQNNRAEVFDHEVEGSVFVHTSYQVIERYKDKTLVEVQLHTGKSHQIRVSFAYLHTPLIADVKYGAKKTTSYSHQALCAYKICFAFEGESGCLAYLKDKELILDYSALHRYLQTL